MPWPSGYPKNMTAEERVVRARHAANSRASTDGLIKALRKKNLTDKQCRQLAELISRDAEHGQVQAS